MLTFTGSVVEVETRLVSGCKKREWVQIMAAVIVYLLKAIPDSNKTVEAD